MNARIVLEIVYLGKKSLQEVAAQSLELALIEFSSPAEILPLPTEE